MATYYFDVLDNFKNSKLVSKYYKIHSKIKL